LRKHFFWTLDCPFYLTSSLNLLWSHTNFVFQLADAGTVGPTRSSSSQLFRFTRKCTPLSPQLLGFRYLASRLDCLTAFPTFCSSWVSSAPSLLAWSHQVRLLHSGWDSQKPGRNGAQDLNPNRFRRLQSLAACQISLLISSSAGWRLRGFRFSDT
jgi:hypothetical protein